MARPKKIVKQTRQTYSDEYRAEALKLADNVGVAAAANKLGIQTSQIYSWRGKSRLAESRTESERKLLALTLVAAMAGGFLGRKSDGEPSVRTIWQGIERVLSFTEMRYARAQPDTG